jgi:hypothetical protein
MVWKSWLFSIVTGLSLAGCVRMPVGPNVMVLPGTGKGFEQFRVDDAVCRQWAAQQVGVTSSQAADDTAVSGAALGTVLGAATGAAFGAASGNPATGAAVGAGAGLLGGSLVGASNAEVARATLQHRYDAAYMQCMYAKGNQVPVPRGSRPRSARSALPPPRMRSAPDSIPPPPGAPPYPPPEW